MATKEKPDPNIIETEEIEAPTSILPQAVALNSPEFKHYAQNVKDAFINLTARPSLEYFGIVGYGLRKFVLTNEEFEHRGVTGAWGFTNGKDIYYLATSNSDFADIIFTTIHEIMHIVGDHINRSGLKDRHIWNLACDHVINTALKTFCDTYDFMKWEDNRHFLLPYLNENDNNFRSAESVYKYMMENRSNFVIKKIKMSCKKQGGSKSEQDEEGTSGKSKGKGKGKPGQGSPGPGGINEDDQNGQGDQDQNEDPAEFDGGDKIDIEYYEVFDKKQNKKFTVAADVGRVDAKSPKQIKDALEKFKGDAAGIYQNYKSIGRGTIPAGIDFLLKEMFKIHIPWHVLLETAILYYAQKGSELSWSRLNECMRIHGINCPGPYDSQDVDAIIYVVDTSGSIGDKDLEKFIGIICNSSHHFQRVIVLTHDYVLQQEIIIDEDTQPDSIFEQIRGIKGRGGTSHKETFDKLEELNEEYNVSSVIFLTDFYSDVESIYSGYKWIKDYETIWVINSGINVNLPGVDTKVIRIEELTEVN